jgi:CYTH domain-containing protein
MGTEIERKFLVIGEDWRCVKPVYFCQGYLNRDKHRTVRVRVFGENAVITVKGISTGATRAEFEYPIPVVDGKQLLQLCEQPLIEKNRYVISYAGKKWEVDEFLGNNQGLVVAEIELLSEDESFDTPDWVGDDVTDDSRYFNSQLSATPFSTWEENRA